MKLECEKGNEYRISRGIELKDCPITQIIRDPGTLADTLVFTYNAWGDPVSVTKLPIPKTGSPSRNNNYCAWYLLSARPGRETITVNTQQQTCEQWPVIHNFLPARPATNVCQRFPNRIYRSIYLNLIF